MRKRNLFYLISLGFLFYSCENNSLKKETPAYFNLKSYFEKQVEELNGNNFKLKKFVSKDAATEEKLFDHPDWKEELKPFSECDINKPSWKNSFHIDSTGDRETFCIKYLAKDSSLKIKSITYCLEHDSLTFIKIEKRTENMYYHFITTLSYFPMKAYSIKSSQKINFTKETTIEVKGLFIRQ
ncbi:MAG: hypothetical protein ABIT08_09015 [Bacteroidia bacterium]